MVVCAAVKCSNSSRIKNMRFFKFPSEEKRRKQWMENSALPSEPGPYAKLCEIHFEESQFELHRQDGWRKLKPNALPTFFPETQERRKRGRREAASSEEDEDSPPTKKTTPPRRRTTPRDTKKRGASTSTQKENVSPAKRKGRPRKASRPEPEPSSSDTEVEEEAGKEEEVAQPLRAENERLRREVGEFERHNRAMSRVILELEKHNKAMATRLQELDRDNKVLGRRVQEVEKQNEELREKLNCCFSEEQYARMEKLMALGKIERYIPGIK